MFNKNKKSKSFTLIELLIVIGLIGILSGLIIAVIDPEKQRARARDGIRQKDLGIISTALEQYYADNNSYPTSTDIAGLGTTLEAGSVYMQSGTFPSDPKSGYAYCYTGSGQTFTLCAAIEALSDALTEEGACNPIPFFNVEVIGKYCVTNSF